MSLVLILSLNMLINSLLKSKFTFLEPIDFTKLINNSLDYFLRLLVYKVIKFKY